MVVLVVGLESGRGGAWKTVGEEEDCVCHFVDLGDSLTLRVVGGAWSFWNAI